MIEMGPEAGAKGGHVIAEGTIADLEAKPESQIGPFLSGKAETKLRRCAGTGEMFAEGGIHLSTGSIHTVKPLELDIPKGRLTVVTGVSGSGKTTMVLESLVPALEAKINGSALPAHIREIRARASRTSSSSTRRPSASMCALPWRPTRASRRAAEALCQISGRQAKGLQGQRFFLQHGQSALPRLRRHR